MSTVTTSLVLVLVHLTSIFAQCPWGRDPALVELQSSCLCALNTQQQLSIQCSLVNFPMLASALGEYARDVPIDLVYVNNSAVAELPDNLFRGLKISNLQMNNAKISKISPNAFRGLEDTLQGLNLAENELTEVPVETLRTLRLLNNLDLTNNRIQYVPNNLCCHICKEEKLSQQHMYCNLYIAMYNTMYNNLKMEFTLNLN